jgi:hypothetical protein
LGDHGLFQWGDRLTFCEHSLASTHLGRLLPLLCWFWKFFRVSPASSPDEFPMPGPLADDFSGLIDLWERDPGQKTLCQLPL